ncbi:MAG: hypothetical protein PHE75_02545 [Candidatus Cloacimonas acidaminovorans]|nr:hypothetical protein [Candidatus Cloacimonas acidaminovorans]OQC14640.1 MAG: hypothetical protein BWX72_01264 [Firmicutes bacterium ADurb.Bin080]
MNNSKCNLDQQLMINIGKSIEPCFELIENALFAGNYGKFDCQPSTPIDGTYKNELKKHFTGTMKNMSGLYFFRIKTKKVFEKNRFLINWKNREKDITATSPINTQHSGKCKDDGKLQHNEFALYVGTVLTVSKIIKEHFRNGSEVPKISSMMIACNQSKSLENIETIRVTYVCFDWLSEGKKGNLFT